MFSSFRKCQLLFHKETEIFLFYFLNLILQNDMDWDVASHFLSFILSFSLMTTSFWGVTVIGTHFFPVSVRYKNGQWTRYQNSWLGLLIQSHYSLRRLHSPFSYYKNSVWVLVNGENCIWSIGPKLVIDHTLYLAWLKCHQFIYRRETSNL